MPPPDYSKNETYINHLNFTIKILENNQHTKAIPAFATTLKKDVLAEINGQTTGAARGTGKYVTKDVKDKQMSADKTVQLNGFNEFKKNLKTEIDALINDADALVAAYNRLQQFKIIGSTRQKAIEFEQQVLAGEYSNALVSKINSAFGLDAKNGFPKAKK